MNGPDILIIARQKLFDAISNFQTPTCDPLQVSPWIAMSLLQKAIRRGRNDLARRPPQRFSTDRPSDYGVGSAALPSRMSAWPLSTRLPLSRQLSPERGSGRVWAGSGVLRAA
jgi:hypothetical protein